MAGLNFRRQQIPLGEDAVPVLVSSRQGRPTAVVMSYEAFLELAATLFVAIDTLRAYGADPAGVDDLRRRAARARLLEAGFSLGPAAEDLQSAGVDDGPRFRKTE